MEDTNQKKFTDIEKVITVFLVIGLAFAIFNQVQFFSIRSGSSNILNNMPTGMAFAKAEIIPTGTPRIYGEELGISYDGISPNNPTLADQTIGVMGNLDRTINLEGSALERYIDITSQISCEYCCGAQSIIVRKEDVESNNQRIQAAIATGKITKEQADKYKQEAGAAACGCAHSYAMRGLAKYLIKEHNGEFTNDEILTELAKWKTLYFPGQMTAKAQILKEKGIESSYINLGSNKYRGIEKGATAGSSMVGGC